MEELDMTDRELMQQALEALIKAHPYSNSNKDLDGHSEAITALRERLAQPEQEPVAHVYLFEPNGRPRVAWDNAKDIKIGDKLYTTPPQGIYYTPPQRKPRQWQGLARLEFQKAVEGLEDLEDCWIAIESALREKNT
jgi:hypothetical protein